MSARPNTDAAQAAEAPKPVYERPMGRRTLLRAMIITVPVVAAFSRNAWAATHPCPAGSKPCAACTSGCIKTACTCNNGQCGKANCNVTLNALLGRNESTPSLTGGPLGGGQSAITDGGFNSNPWR